MEGNKANFFAEVEKILEYEERKKVLLIYNPKSGNGVFPNYLDLIIRRFQERGFLIRPIRGTEHRILDYAFSHNQGTRLPVVPPCLYRISIPLHLMITESPFPIKGHSRVVFGSFRAGYSHQMYPSLSSFRTYSSCQRVVFSLVI